MEAILAVAIAVAGWVVTHFSGIRAHDRQFRQAILNQAREALTESINVYQRWASRVGASLLATRSSLQIAQELGIRHFVQNRLTEWPALFWSAGSNRWITQLEEYEILFPETRNVRGRLVWMDRELRVRLSKLTDLLRRILRGDSEALERLSAEVDALHEECLNLSSLAEDIKIHLQNVTLSELMGRAVPQREPQDPGVERIVLGPDGNLILTTGHDLQRNSSA